MDKLNKTFAKKEILTAQAMNDIVGKINELVENSGDIDVAIKSGITETTTPLTEQQKLNLMRWFGYSGSEETFFSNNVAFLENASLSGNTITINDGDYNEETNTLTVNN